MKTVNFVKATNYTAVMTGSWDKTIKVNYSQSHAHSRLSAAGR